MGDFLTKLCKIYFVVLFIFIEYVLSKIQKENENDVDILLPLPPVNKTYLRHTQNYKFKHGINIVFSFLDIDASYNILLDVIMLVITFWIFISVIFCRFHKKISNYLAITPRNMFEKEGLTKYDIYPPSVNGTSSILDIDHILLLYCHIPPHAQVLPFNLLYKASEDGYSLMTLYNKCKNYQCSCMLIIKTEEHVIIGAYLSEPPTVGNGFKGDGTTFLFRFTENDIECYYWQHTNRYFGNYSKNVLGIGSEGGYGIRLDDTLLNGVTEHCNTFNNPPLVKSEHFSCLEVEVWGMHCCLLKRFEKETRGNEGK